MAVGAIAGAVLSAPHIVFGTPLYVIGDNEIEPPVFVVIEPGDTVAHGFEIVFLVRLRRVLPERNPCRFTHVGISNGTLPFCSFDRLFGANTLHSKQYCEASGYRDQSGPEKLTNFFP